MSLPINLHLIFGIFEISSLMNWIFFQVWTGFFCLLYSSLKYPVHQTGYFKLENCKNRVQIDRGNGLIYSQKSLFGSCISFFQRFKLFSFVFQLSNRYCKNDNNQIGTNDQKKKCLGEVFNSAFVQHTKRWTSDKWHQSLNHINLKPNTHFYFPYLMVQGRQTLYPSKHKNCR